MAHLPSHHTPKLIYEMDMLYRKNHAFIVNLKSTNLLENKIGLLPYSQMYRLMQNLTMCLAES